MTPNTSSQPQPHQQGGEPVTPVARKVVSP